MKICKSTNSHPHKLKLGHSPALGTRSLLTFGCPTLSSMALSSASIPARPLRVAPRYNNETTNAPPGKVARAFQSAPTRPTSHNAIPPNGAFLTVARNSRIRT